MITVLFPDGSCREVPLGRKQALPAEEIILSLALNPYEVILSRDGCVIPEDTLIEDGEEIRLISVVHGG